MGWYLKKSFSFGPLRLNLSKSGLGASVGVKGLRVSTGPKGRQINAGREGLYYRASLNPPHDPQEPVPETHEQQAGAAASVDQDTLQPAVPQPMRRQLGVRVLRGIVDWAMRRR